MKVLSVGQPYPTPISLEGTYSDFLRDGGNRLIIAMADIEHSELKALKSGKVECGVAYQAGAMIIVWRFNDRKGRPVLTLDSPFQAKDVRDLALPDIENDQQRLFVELHVVDMTTRTLKAIRGFTLSPEFSVAFLSSVQDQLAHPGDGMQQLQQWFAQPVTGLASQVKMHQCGEV